jgi:hypothetical protein
MKDIGEKCEEPLVPSLLGSINEGAFTETTWLALGNTTYTLAIAGMV